MNTTTVRSELARSERNDDESPRCASRLTLKGHIARMMNLEAGTVLECTRPASRHRVHEYGSLQWEKGDK